jgi:hypothetical protein
VSLAPSLQQDYHASEVPAEQPREAVSVASVAHHSLMASRLSQVSRSWPGYRGQPHERRKGGVLDAAMGYDTSPRIGGPQAISVVVLLWGNHRKYL